MKRSRPGARPVLRWDIEIGGERRREIVARWQLPPPDRLSPFCVAHRPAVRDA